MYKVYPTVSEPTSNPTYSKFLAIFNMAFPLKVEKEYVTLTNLIIEYIQAAHHYKADGQMPNQEYDNLNIKANSYLEQLNGILTSLTSDSPSSAYEEFARIANAAYQVSKKKEQFGKNLDIQRDNYNKANGVASDAYNDILNIINALANQLQVIKELNLGSQNRLNDLCVTDKHLNLINSLNITDIEKATLKRLLQSFFNLRVSSFTTVENFAQGIVSSYQKRILLESDSPEFQNGQSAALALSSIQIGDHGIHNTISPVYCDIINNECLVMDLISEFFSTGQINNIPTDIDSLTMNYNTREAFKAIINSLPTKSR
ncbi:MAG: hypothetical protein K2J20_04785 [Bacilli bacterium]|nr:hypothetical protein [Bacilli bacterium]